MNILHLQFDTEIRTLYQVEAMRDVVGATITLAYAGPSYGERFGYGEELFSKVYSLPYVSLRDIFFINKSRCFRNLVENIKYIVKENDIDIIHVHKRTDIQCLAALKTGTPTIIDVHDLVCLMEDSIFGSQGSRIFRSPLIGSVFGKHFYKRLLNLEEYCLKHADYVIVVSPLMKSRVLNLYNVEPAKVQVLPNTVPLKYCSFKSKNNYSNPIKAIMATSFFLDKNSKSHRDILSFIEVIKEIKDIEIYLYGWTKGFYKKDIELYFSKYPNITYKGLLSPSQYLNIIEQYDVGVIFNNPDYDVHIGEISLPKKLFEYAAKGLPVLAYASKQIAEFVYQYKIGSVFDEVSVDSIEAAIKDIKKNYELYSMNALRLIKKECNWEKQTKTLLNIYSKVID